MTLKVNYIITDSNITLNFEGQTHIVPRSEALSDQLIEALRNKDYKNIPNLISMAKKVETFSKGSFQIVGNNVMLGNWKVPDFLSRKIISFMNEKLPYEPLVKFAENLQKNPSFRAVQELFQFLEKNDHPITENGNFIAYKKVRDNFLDVHSGTMDNSPGKTVEVPRNAVDEDCNRTCSYGLHAANFDYASNFYAGGKMLELEINPADVVAIPTDYNQAKMRVCKYLVLGEVKKELSTPLRKVNNDVEDDSQEDNLEDLDYCDFCGGQFPLDELADDGICDDCCDFHSP